VLLLVQADIVEQKILSRFEAFHEGGGRIIKVGPETIQNVEGQVWRGSTLLTAVAPVENSRTWLKQLLPLLARCKGADGQLDGLWTTRRGKQTMIFNSKDAPVSTPTADGEVRTIAPHTIWWN
jgi:hypothetical protein